MSEGTQHRLAAIVAADIVGYSRLIAADEAGTLAAMRAHRSELWDPTTEAYGERLVGTAGDSRLVEFPSAVAAVESAVAIQRAMVERNAGFPEDRRIRLRIGINLGEVVVEGNDIHGDGVNIAARLEALAEPGGISLSDDVLRQVRGRIEERFEDDGIREMKNIAAPVHVWRWSSRASNAATSVATAGDDRPSIAVLPFDNMSSDAELEFFGDGISEDIITTLSKVSGMRVIARNSSFAYKGTSPDIRQVAQDLGVRYVLEGSVRSRGERLSITAQLIDADGGSHVWAERYNRQAEDLFDIQDDITKEVVTNLRVNLTDGEAAAGLNSKPTDIEAWRLTGQGLELQAMFHAETNLRAREMGERACRIDPDYGPAWALVGVTYWYEARIGSADMREANLGKAEECFERAWAADPDNTYVLELGSQVFCSRGEHEKAIELLRNGLNANPGSAEIRAFLANAHHWAGSHEEAVRLYNEAKRLNPLHAIWYYAVSARAADAIGDDEGALGIVREGLRRQDDSFPCQLLLASLLGRRGELEEARKALERALLLSPDFTLDRIEQWLMTRDKSYTALFTEGLKAAGLR